MLVLLLICAVVLQDSGVHLVDAAQIRYVGSFDIPKFGTWKDPANRQSAHSLGTIGYRADVDGLYVVTHAQNPTAVGLVKVPRQLKKDFVAMGEMIQKPIDLLSIPDRQGHVRGLYWDGDTKTLFYNVTAWYNVAGQDFAGMGALRDGKQYGLWYTAHNNAAAGYLSRDPQSGRWFAGSAIACGLSTSSLGPSIYQLAFDGDSLPTAGAKIGYTTLQFHPHGSPTPQPEKYAVMSNGKRWRHGMEVTGGVCSGGAILIAVDEGKRSFYGTPDQFRESFGFTPRKSGKGYHNDPHRPMIWMYSVGALKRERKRGARLWSGRPYGYFPIQEMPEEGRLSGLAYDPVRHRLFVSQQRGNPQHTPRIYVYRIDHRNR